MPRRTRVWVLLTSLLGVSAEAQPLVPVTASWDAPLATSPAHPITAYELERDGVVHACAPLTETSCRAQVPTITGTYRLRGLNDLGAGPWSEPGSGGSAVPGSFTITEHHFTSAQVPTMAVSYTTHLAPQAVSFLAAGETENITFDAGTASNRVLFVAVQWRDRSNDLSGITYNGVSLTSLTAKITQGIESARLFALYGPASGSNTLAVTMGAGGNTSTALISCLVVDGADSTTPWDTLVSATGSGSTANIQSAVTVSSASGDRVVFFHFTQNGTATITATPTNYTERADGTEGSGFSTEFGDADGAASVTGTATWSNGAYSVNWIAFGVNVNAAGGTAYNLALDSASVAITAQSVGLSSGRKLVTDAASITTTAQDVALRTARLLGLDALSLNIDAQNVTLRNTRTLGLDSASIAASAQDVTFALSGYRLTLDAAPMNLGVQDLSFFYDRLLALDPATYSLSAQALTLTQGRRIATDPASFTSTMQNVTLRADRRLTLDPMTVAIAAQDVQLDSTSLTHFTLALDAASVALTGQNVALVAGRTLGLDHTSVVAAAQAAILRATRTLRLDHTSVAITAQDVAIGRQITLQLDPTAVVVTPQDMTLLKQYRLALSAISYALNIQALTFDYSGNLIGIIHLDGSYSPLVELAGSFSDTVSLLGSVHQ